MSPLTSFGLFAMGLIVGWTLGWIMSGNMRGSGR